MTYELLSDEDKIAQAIEFVALGQPIPEVLELFLRDNDLWDFLVPSNGEADVG